MRWDLITGQFRVYEKGGSAPTSQTTVNQLYSPEEAAWRALVMGSAANVFNKTSDTISTAPFPGAKPVGPSADTEAAQNYLRNFAASGGTNLIDNAFGATNFALGPVLFPESNPALRATQAAAIRPVTEAYTDPGGVFSNIRTGATQAGQVGSSRQGIAEGIAGGRYLSTIGDISSKVATEGYGRGLDTFTRALGLAPSVYGLGLQPGATLSAVGTSGEAYAQAEEDFNASSRLWDLNAPWMPVENFANIVFGGASPGTQTTTTGPAARSNTALSALGGAATGASLASMMMMNPVLGAGAGLIFGLLG